MDFPSNRFRNRFQDRYVAVEDLHPFGIRSRIIRGKKEDGTLEVIKFLPSNDMRITTRHRLVDERDALVAIGAPHVPAILHDGAAEPHPFLILSNVPGRSLEVLGTQDDDRQGRTAAKRLRQTGELQKVYERFAAIFNLCHRRGILHNDLSLSNLMVVIEGDEVIDVCLLDFGECLKLLPKTIYTSRAGTENYFCRNKVIGNPIRREDDFESLFIAMQHVARRLRAPSLTYIGGS